MRDVDGLDPAFTPPRITAPNKACSRTSAGRHPHLPKQRACDTARQHLGLLEPNDRGVRPCLDGDPCENQPRGDRQRQHQHLRCNRRRVRDDSPVVGLEMHFAAIEVLRGMPCQFHSLMGHKEDVRQSADHKDGYAFMVADGRVLIRRPDGSIYGWRPEPEHYLTDEGSSNQAYKPRSKTQWLGRPLWVNAINEWFVVGCHCLVQAAAIGSPWYEGARETVPLWGGSPKGPANHHLTAVIVVHRDAGVPVQIVPIDGGAEQQSASGVEDEDIKHAVENLRLNSMHQNAVLTGQDWRMTRLEARINNVELALRPKHPPPTTTATARAKRMLGSNSSLISRGVVVRRLSHRSPKSGGLLVIPATRPPCRYRDRVANRTAPPARGGREWPPASYSNVR